MCFFRPLLVQDVLFAGARLFFSWPSSLLEYVYLAWTFFGFSPTPLPHKFSQEWSVCIIKELKWSTLIKTLLDGDSMVVPSKGNEPLSGIFLWRLVSTNENILNSEDSEIISLGTILLVVYPENVSPTFSLRYVVVKFKQMPLIVSIP